MADHYSTLRHALAGISEAAATDDLWRTVKEFAARLGYSYVIAVDAAKIVAGIRQAVFYSDAPAELLASIDQEMVYEHHPFVQRALKSDAPFTVSELRRDPELAGKKWEELTADVIRQGEGLIVPVYRHGEPLAGFNFGGIEPDVSALARAMLQVVAHAAIDRLLELRSLKGAMPAPLLSVRETQCLRYVALGHSDAEISQKLGISARTVRFHVDSAKAKLGVSTRVQAVAKALREHVIAV